MRFLKPGLTLRSHAGECVLGIKV